MFGREREGKKPTTFIISKKNTTTIVLGYLNAKAENVRIEVNTQYRKVDN